MAEIPDLEVWTRDRQFGLFLSREKLAEILGFCRSSGHRETGGVLIGRYTKSLDLARVEHVTGPPTDSRAGRTWFDRGIAGLKSLLLARWRRERDYYLGEWHFHPGGPPLPSPADVAQMKGIASSSALQCPEPILLILGGNPNEKWRVSVWVYPQGKEPQEMSQTIGPTKSTRSVS